MREGLAERLLATAMGWDEADVARERPVLQAFADYKYDEYEQFQPGLRFIESLARWLVQFPELDQRRAAYNFIRERLIFVSRAEMHHLVTSVYPDVVRPLLLRRAARDLDMPEHLVGRVSVDPAFKLRHRSCLYVGLSDGARTAVLRRANSQISNEQVVAEYSALPSKGEGLLKDLRADLGERGFPGHEDARFTTVVLLDDLSASGISYVRPEVAGKGKISKVAEMLRGEASGLIDADDLEVVVVLYVGTEQALAHLKTAAAAFEKDVGGRWRVRAVQRLSEQVVVSRGDNADLDDLIDETYDPAINDKHMEKGLTDGRYGFADCGLPLVVEHNTPNNSLALLWADTDKFRGLFPRVSRHREEP